MNLLDAIVLGIIQGLTEFLPVSSSGHLVIGKALLGVQVQGIAFEVFVHFGTLLSVIVVYRKDILILIQSVVAGLGKPSRIRQIYRNDKNLRLAFYIILATLPAGLIGLFFSSSIETAFNEEKTVSFLLIVTGIVLLLTRVVGVKDREMKLSHAMLIGFAQALAILPGISRSGSTISVALYIGISREEAARFSFLLAVPVILGATILKLFELFENVPPASQLYSLATGTVAAFVSGYAAIKLLLVFVRKGRLDYFAWYCFALGSFGLIYF